MNRFHLTSNAGYYNSFKGVYPANVAIEYTDSTECLMVDCTEHDTAQDAIDHAQALYIEWAFKYADVLAEQKATV